MNISAQTLMLLPVLTMIARLGLQSAAVFTQNTMVTYQGRVTNHGTNINGACRFKLALVASANTSGTATAASLSGAFETSHTVTVGGTGYGNPPAATPEFSRNSVTPSLLSLLL